MPDIIGVSEVENLKVLRKLADQINSDAVAAGQPDPKYVGHLEEGNDGRGIDVGYLVKSTKLKVIEVVQLAKDQVFAGVSAGVTVGGNVFDRPPLMIRVEAIDASNAKPLALTIVVNHFKSYGGISDEKDGPAVRAKRRSQAEWLAKWVDDRQKADATEKILICGDLNSFQFNDGYNDLVGILKGKSDPNVLSPSKTAYATGLVALVDRIEPKTRYSYSFDGSAQVLDHILVNKAAGQRVLKFGYSRGNADFPDVWAGDATRPERISDHDAPVVYLSLDEPKPTATPKPTPQ
jgi:predicted extracellular nuclease